MTWLNKACFPSGTALLACLTCLLPSVRAANITLSGTFTADDNIQLFDISLTAPAQVGLRSYGYAGGVIQDDSGITVVRSGGFDTILTLFSASGTFLSENDDGAGVATDPSTGLAADARITTTLATGSYIVALTQFDNFAKGSNLADGFFETGHPNFTADPSFATGGPCPGNLFRDISGTAGRCRSGNWAVNFADVASVTPVAPVPEPSTVGLLGLSLIVLAWVVRKKRSHQFKPLSGLLALLTAFLAILPANQLFGQSGTVPSSPNFTNVSDYLNGQRTLLRRDDLVVGGLLLKTSPGSQIPTSGIQPLPNVPGHSMTSVSLARMFDLPVDTYLYTTGNAVHARNLLNEADVSVTLPTQTIGQCNATGDFNSDGFAEVALCAIDGVRVVGAVDPHDFSKGLRVGPPLPYNPGREVVGGIDLAVGDFDGNGTPDIAVAYPDTTHYETQVHILHVDPATFALTQGGTTTVGVSSAGGGAYAPITIGLAAGRFGSPAGVAPNHDQLMLGFYAPWEGTAGGAGFWETDFVSFDFAKDLKPIQRDKQFKLANGDQTSGTAKPSQIRVKTGHFDPASPYDQAAVYYSYNNQQPQLAVIGLDANLQFNYPKFVNESTQTCGSYLAVGNFYREDPEPTKPSNPQPSLKMQLATTVSDCNGSLDIHIYDVEPPSTPGGDFTVNPNWVFGNHLTDPPFTHYSGDPLVAGDIQGRSLELGAPTKIVINGTTQPSVISGMPPMHIDYVVPADGDQEGKPIVLNLTAVPGGFNTQYSTTQEQKNQSSVEGTTSWSLGFNETATAGVKIGDPETTGLSITDTAKAGQALNTQSGKSYGSYSGSSFNATSKTHFGDEITFHASRLNIWVYPVIGKMVCPVTTPPDPNCPDVAKQPLTVQFSAADQIEPEQRLNGNQVEWYQPPWEPGNIFSYPANLSQLHQILPDLQQLSNPSTWATDGNSSSIAITWSSGGSSANSASLDQTFSFSNNFSVAGSIGVSGVGSITGGLELDISGSNGFSTLTKSETTVGQTTGVTVSVPQGFADPNSYQYPVTTYLLGATKPVNVVNNSAPPADLKSFGILQTAFTVDPTGPYSGPWWQDAYPEPDVALNHPTRWSYYSEALPSGKPDKNCLYPIEGGSSVDCFDLSNANFAHPWMDTFHAMRGFFISNYESGGKGPQLEIARAGDQLLLQARVYNYSLQEMPSGTKVHVRFYAQPLDGHKNPVGGSVLINEVLLDRIPPFAAKEGSPLNWTPAGTKFDTTNFANQTLAFWVIVWMQAPDGSLVAELNGHGLTAIPGTLNSFADLKGKEETYGNNIGFYRWPFTILPKQKNLAQAQAGVLEMGKMELSTNRGGLGDPISVSVPLSATGSDAFGVTVFFFDGDPRQGGEPFDTERIPYIETGTDVFAQVSYQPPSCETHEIFAVVNQGLPTEVIRRAEPVRVDCSGSAVATPIRSSPQK